MSTRRDFIKTGGALALAGSLGRCSAAGPPTPPTPGRAAAAPPADAAPAGMRVITYNVLKCGGHPLNEATRPRLEAARPRMDVRFAEELLACEPDIISFQEAPSEAVVASIATRLGMNHCFFASPRAWPGAVLTRYDIRRADNCPLRGAARPAKLFTRHFGRAVLETEVGPLIVYSAHLHPAQRERREGEAERILLTMGPDLKSDRSLLFMGDLNLLPSSSEYRPWIDAGLVDLACVGGRKGDSTYPSDRPRVRIDYIFGHGPIVPRLQECRTLFEGAFRTNPADPTSFALSDHVPVMATFA